MVPYSVMLDSYKYTEITLLCNKPTYSQIFIFPSSGMLVIYKCTILPYNESNYSANCFNQEYD
jgi:hypothetical protein